MKAFNGLLHSFLQHPNTETADAIFIEYRLKPGSFQIGNFPVFVSQHAGDT